jgi:hypothetical protein
MPQHSNGKAMSQPSARNMWRPDSEFWSANRAEHRFADGYELVAFDLPHRERLSGHNRLGIVRRA